MLENYNPKWKDNFLNEKKLIKNTLGNYVIDIQHIGSTSVPGLSAKPIIDIAVIVSDISNPELFSETLKKIEYSYKPKLSSGERIFLRKGNPVTFHLSITESKFGYWKNQILFRDYLRNHPEAVDEYVQIKKLAISQSPDVDLADLSVSETYNNIKGPFIAKVLVLAQEELKK